jgi:hypothetical protein
MVLLFVVGVFEGLIVASLFSGLHLSAWVKLAAQFLGAITVWRLCVAQNRRIDRYERERQNWKTGAEGECTVALALTRLSTEFVVFHDFDTRRGNFDHLVIGPTGVFAIETKNWRGTIGADGLGELTQNGAPSSQAHVKQFARRIMAVREQAIALTGREMFIQGIMVFPKARVEAGFGSTRSVHCVRDKRLCAYIEDRKFRRELTTDEIALFTRAFRGIAGMDPGFGEATGAAVRRPRDKQEAANLASCSSVS